MIIRRFVQGLMPILAFLISSMVVEGQDLTNGFVSEVGSDSTASPETSQIIPGQVQTAASRVYVFVDKKGFGHQHGIEGKLQSGSLLLGARSSAGQLVFDMTSFDADTTTARSHFRLAGETDASTRTKVNENMRAYVLKPDRYPTATFAVDSALATGAKSPRELPIYELSGNFTLCGKTRPLKILADVEVARGWLHVRGNFSVKQTEYGITPYSTALGAVGVADQLRIDGDLFVSPHGDLSLDSIPQRKEP